MKKIFLLFSLFLVICVNAQQTDLLHKDLIHRERASALAKLLHQPLADTGNYDIKFHRLELFPSLTQRQLTGIVTTYYVPTQDITQIEFDLSSQMTVQSVTQRGSSLNFSQTNNKLIIDFSQVAGAGVLDSLSIHYGGTVPDSGFGSYEVTQHGSTPIVWTLSEPYGARDWWPCKQDLTDKADSVDVILHYPRYYNAYEMQAVSNGLLTSETILSDSETLTEYKITTWKHRYPIAAYLVAFSITNYTLFSQTAGIDQSFPIDNYVFPEDLGSAQAQADNFVPVMNFFEEKFGPYPFNNEKYGQVQFGWGGGMEHQTATFLSNYSRYLVSHELAHQWFGDAITCGSWHDIWLNEGFATYAEALTREHFDGQAVFDAWKEESNDYITSSPDGAVYVQDTTDVWRIFDGRLSYRKGAMVLNMLRLKMGDFIFFQGLKNYVVHKNFQYVHTVDFRTEMEIFYMQNLEEFFNDWIYGEGYPTYNIQVSRVGEQQYEVVVNQTTSHSSVDFFEMPLPFVFYDDNGATYEMSLNHTVNNQHFLLDFPIEITQVEFDPHHDILKGPTSINVNLNSEILPQDSFKVYPVPSHDYLFIKNNTSDRIIDVCLTDMTGKEVLKLKNKDKISIKELRRGNYLIIITTDKGRLIKNIIKE